MHGADDILVGGFGELTMADAGVQEICDELKSQAEKKAGVNYAQFEAISYRTQIVAGINYKIKVKVGDSLNSYIHLGVFQPLPCNGSTLELNAMTTGMTLEDPLD